jgi:TP901 family phage tail tape measure protein
MAKMTTATDQFSKRLDAGKLSLREYYRYSMASTRTFGRFFGKEFDTVGNLIQKRVKTLQSQYVGLGRDAQGALNAMRMTPKKLNYNDQLTKMQMMIQRQQIFNKLLDDGSTRLLNFGKNTQWAGRQLMVGFTIPLAMFAASAIKSFKEIETQAIRFKKVYGDIFTTQNESEAALKQMQKIADEYTKYGLKVSETIKTAADAAAAGNAGKDLEEVVRQANKLAVLGGVAQDKSLETIVALKNAFGITAAELGKNIDFLNAVENQTVLTLEDMTEAIPRVGPIIRQLGGDVQDLSVFLAAMKEGGVSAAQGANALKSGLASLINPSTAAIKATSALGINLKAIVESNAGNLKATVMEFASSLSTLNDLQRGQIIEKIFGKYQFARLSAMFNNITKDGTQANRVMKLAVASAEELAILSERELKVQENSAMNKMQQQIEKLKAAIAPIGELFAKTLTPVIEFFVKLFNKFNEMPDAIKKIVAIVVAGIAGIGPVVLMTVGLVANGIANMMKMFNLVRQGYQRLSYGSRDAALSTRYMTQEELENAAVTNSLTTKHQALSAAYVLEASSLRSLTAVYQQANAAMMTFSKNNPGMFMPGAPKGGGVAPRKYNKGVSYVPGTGNTDTVPAMLTPGEAVIPKGMVKKHGSLISAIVGDQVPGHMYGIRSVFPMMAAEPAVVGKLSFGAAGRVGGSGPVRMPSQLSLVEQQFASISSMKIGAPNAKGLVPIDFGGGVTILVDSKKVSSFKNELMKNEEYQLARGDSPEQILQTIRKAITKPGRKLVNQQVSPSRLKGILPFGQASRTRAVPKEVKMRRRLYANSPQYQALVAEHEAEVSYLKSIASGPNQYGLTLDDLITVSRGSRRGKEDFGYAPAFSHRQKADSQLFNTTTRNRPSNLFEEHSFLNKFFEENSSIIGGIHVARKDQAEQVVKALSVVQNKTASQKAAQAIFERRLSTGFYDVSGKNLGRRSSQYSLLKSSGMTKEEISALPQVPLQMNAGGIVPGYMAGIAAVPKKPLFLGMPLTAKQVADKRSQQSIMAQIDEGVKNSRFSGTTPTAYGEQVSATIGHSFPVPGVGGIYKSPSGDLVFVKPVVDEVAALAEQRATVIAREAHGLKAPKQTIKTMLDPTDPAKKRRIIVLESPVEEQFANMTGKFTKDEYVKQLVASALRGDKDLAMSNLSGNVLADVGTAGVFERASGVRAYADNMPSMADQAKINLLGTTGGAKRFFAESTLDVARSMTAQEYQAAMIREINETLPRLRKTISNFQLNEKEQVIYNNMIKRLEEGAKVNWADYHLVHTSVVPQVKKPLSAAQILKKQEEKALRERQSGHANKAPYHYNKGVFSVPGTGNQDTVPAMLTPGEAVIPKEMASKYAPLVDGIITDSIPGHKVGKNGKGGVPRPLPGQNFDGPSPVRPNWRGRYYKARDQFSSTLSRAQERAQARLAAVTAKTADRIEKFEKSVSNTSGRVKEFGQTTRIVNNEFAGDKTRGFRAFLNGYGNVSQTVTNEDGTKRAATAVERENMRQGNRMNFTQKMMPLQMAGMMVPMIAQGIANKNPDGAVAKNMDMIMLLSTMVMLLPMLNSPLKLLIGSVAGLAVIFKMQSAAIKKNILEGEKQGKAMLMTTNGLEELGKITNTVSATQIADAKRKSRNTDIVPVSMEFGNNVIGNSDFGKVLKTSFEQTMADFGSGAAVDSLVNQLGTAVSQGVLDRGQAESIAVALTRNLKDAKLELDVRGRLIQLLGPNGENLVSDPLKVQIELLASGQRLQDTAVQNLNKVAGQQVGINTKMEFAQLGAGAVGGGLIAARAGVQAANMASVTSNAAAIASAEARVAKIAQTAGQVSKALTIARNVRVGAQLASAGASATGVGTIPGLVGLAVSTVIFGGIEAGIRSWQKGKEKAAIGKAAGIVQGIVSENLAASQGSIDALTSQYDTAIANLELKKKTLKTEQERTAIDKQILDLQSKKDTGLQTLRNRQSDILASAVTSYEGVNKSTLFEKISPLGSGRGQVRDKYMEAFSTAMQEKFKDNATLKAQATALQSQLDDLGKDEVTLQISTLVTSDVLTPNEASTMLSTLTSTGGDIQKNLESIVSVQGTEGLQRLSTILTLIPNEVNKIDLMVSVKQMNKAEADATYTAIEELGKVPDYVGIDLNIETEKNDISSLQKTGKEIAALKKQFPNGEVNLKALIKMQEEAGGPGKNFTLDAAIRDWNEISKLPKELQFQAIFTMASIEVSDSFDAMLKSELDTAFEKANPKYAGQQMFATTESRRAFQRQENIDRELFTTDPKNIAAARKAALDKLRTQIFGIATPTAVPGGGANGAGSDKAKRDNSWLMDLAQQLKLVKDSSIDALNPLASIKKFLGGDVAGQGGGSVKTNKSLDKQLGAIQQIDQLALKGNIAGLSDDFREILINMDPEQFKLWASLLFKVGKDGRINEVTQDFIDINSAFRTATIGTYIESQQKANDEIRDRVTAYNRLVDITKEYGFAISDTDELLKDQSLAADIANGVKYSKEELAALVAINKEAKSLRAQEATVGQKQENNKMQMQIDAFKKLQDAGIEYETILQVISKSEWVEAVLSSTGKIQDEWPNLIKSAKDYKKVLFELQQIQESKSTKMDQRFAAESARINAAAMSAFRTANKMSVEQFNVVTKEKENLQRTYQDQIDTYNDGIDSIEKLESSVNDKYETRAKLLDEQANALDKVLSVNQDIAAQQQNQLTLADALTQGDISAAAKAAADYSAQQAEVASRSASEALNQQKADLEIQKQKEIDALTTSINGKIYTRKQLEDAITKIQDDSIAPLEKEIEARNRLVQAHEEANAKALANIEINNLTSTEWDAIKGAVTALNEAYDAQVLDIDAIASSVGGVSGAWNAVTTAIKGAALELGKYPVFGDEAAKTKAAAELKAKQEAEAKAKAEAEAKAKAEAEAKKKAEEEAKKKAEEDAAKMGTPFGQSGSWIDRKLWRMGFMASGGFVPQYFASGGFAKGTDTIPAMVTPGEFIVKKNVAEQYGALLESLNNGTFKTFEAPRFNTMDNDAVKVGAGSTTSVSDNSSRVYNYNVGISVNNTSASADDIAKVVMAEIKYIDSQRLRGQR